MTILYDGFGAPITESVREAADCGSEGRTETDPASAWVRCVCGWEAESIESAVGGVAPTAVLFEEHLDEMNENGEGT